MKTVGIRELKIKLSRYINEVRGGSSVLVTDHGEEVAIVVPLSIEYLVIRQLTRSGSIPWSLGKPRGLFPRVPVEGVPLSSTVLEERE